MSAPTPEPAPVLRNCFSCWWGGAEGRDCNALTLDEKTDAPILKWAESFGGFAEDGKPPADADGCPTWMPRPREVTR